MPLFFLWKTFRKVLRFSSGYKREFEISFLKNLKLLKILQFSNEQKIEKMHKAWEALWEEQLEEKSISRQREFTQIFIQHIDNLIDLGQWRRVISLIEIYITYVAKRDIYSIGYDIFPKFF
ncbi:MAG: hypothetical protein OXN83_03865 [Oligoflexia bacterium]|nr:hypothetical protein [Oligoflexia bacterium]